MPNGKLCSRKDREKCPFHGKIIARDNTGQPSKAQDRVAEEKRKETEQQRNPDWQDPNLLKDLEAATGIDLKMPTKKGKGGESSDPACLLAYSLIPLSFSGKGKGTRDNKRHSSLVNIRESENTVRKRLEKKVLNRSSLKRIAAVNNRIDARRHRDKFADQFNYIFS